MQQEYPRARLCEMAGNEKILWRGRPDKKCFILESIFNSMLPFALIWGLIDFGIMIAAGANSVDSNTMIALVFFMLLHLAPVWIYISGVFFSFRKYRNTHYLITDRAVYVSGGLFSVSYETKPFSELSHINIHRGIIDQYLGVGDVIMACNHSTMNINSSHSHFAGIVICDIADYQKVYNMVKEIQTDVYSDTMFPNDLRPKENHGYKTRYTKPDNWET